MHVNHSPFGSSFEVGVTVAFLVPQLPVYLAELRLHSLLLQCHRWAVLRTPVHTPGSLQEAFGMVSGVRFRLQEQSNNDPKLLLQEFLDLLGFAYDCIQCCFYFVNPLV